MSLRVLLADESDTIKKVFQLALQDLNAEVKSVHSGLDVIDVAKTFKPDIIFADVLLQKKNGYDLCLQIKQSSDLKNIPVVLMWSSFMELDQEQFKRSLASDQLEKPFDADLLREIVKKYSSAVDSNPMAQFLNFPQSTPKTTTATEHSSTHKGSIPLSFDLVESTPKAQTSQPIALEESFSDEDTSEFNLSSILGDSPTSSSSRPTKSLFDDLAIDAAPTTNQESWKEKDLSQFQLAEDKSDDLDQFEALNLSTNPRNPDMSASALTPPSSEHSLDRFSLTKTVLPSKEISREITRDATNTTTKSSAQKSVSSSLSSSISSMTGMNDSEIEAIVRAHTEEVIKNQIQDSLLHVVEKIVREELHRIMEQEIRLQQDTDFES